jgi:hypothetical protein
MRSASRPQPRPCPTQRPGLLSNSGKMLLVFRCGYSLVRKPGTSRSRSRGLPCYRRSSCASALSSRSLAPMTLVMPRPGWRCGGGHVAVGSACARLLVYARGPGQQRQPWSGVASSRRRPCWASVSARERVPVLGRSVPVGCCSSGRRGRCGGPRSARGSRHPAHASPRTRTPRAIGSGEFREPVSGLLAQADAWRDADPRGRFAPALHALARAYAGTGHATLTQTAHSLLLLVAREPRSHFPAVATTVRRLRHLLGLGHRLAAG